MQNANTLIPKSAAGARDHMHLLANIRMIWRPIAQHGFGIDTNQVANPTLRDMMVPHRPDRRFPPLPAAALVSSAVSQQVFPRHHIQHRIRDQPLELCAFFLELLQTPGIRHVSATLLGLQLVKVGKAACRRLLRIRLSANGCRTCGRPLPQSALLPAPLSSQ